MSFPSETMIQQHVTKEHLEATGKGAVDTLRCHLCIFEANSPLQLQSHLIEHTFAGCAALNCYICQALFTLPIALQVLLYWLFISNVNHYRIDLASLLIDKSTLLNCCILPITEPYVARTRLKCTTLRLFEMHLQVLFQSRTGSSRIDVPSYRRRFCIAWNVKGYAGNNEPN